MIRMIDRLDYLTCDHGRPASVFEETRGGQVRYIVESHCCNYTTAPFIHKQNAINEYSRVRAAIEADKNMVMP